MTGLASEQTAADDRVSAIRRRTARWRAVGAGVGMAAGLWSMQAGALGRGLLLAAPFFAIFVLGGVLLGELAVRPQAVGQRSATLVVRHLSDYLPSGLTAAVAAETCVLLAVLTATTLAASPDDLGRAGRMLARTCGTTGAWSLGPWPGSFYSVPLILILLTGLLASWATLRRVTLRARVVAAPEVGIVDDSLRRRAGEMIVAAFGILVGVPFSGVGVLVSIALIAAHQCAPAWWPIAGWLLLALVGMSLALLVWCTTVLVDGHGYRPRLPSRGSSRL
jgi:hypothetical protein